MRPPTDRQVQECKIRMQKFLSSLKGQTGKNTLLVVDKQKSFTPMRAATQTKFSLSVLYVL